MIGRGRGGHRRLAGRVRGAPVPVSGRVSGDRGRASIAHGPAGVGRRTSIRAVVASLPPNGEPFEDWVYVNNFDDAHRPRALKLPYGTAIPFRDAMAELIEELAGAIPAALESDGHDGVW